VARIDQLIAAMIEHSASALSVAEGQRPSLNIVGTEHTVAKQVLDAAQLTGLLIEIAPDESRSALQTGLVEPREAYLKAIDKAVLAGMFQAKQIPTDFLE